MTDAQTLATPYLAGNHDPCPACELQRAAQDPARIFRAPVRCQVCKGKGYLALTDAEIVRRTIAWARAHYWPGRFDT